MTKHDFTDAAEQIFAAHGKKLPNPAILDAIFKRISELPKSFLAYAVQELEDTIELPKNLGRYLLRDVWPEYLDKHPEMRASQQRRCCPLCASELPGWRKIWGPAPDYECKVVRCTCGNAGGLLDEPVFTDGQLLAAGWSLEPPFCYTRQDPPEWFAQILGHTEPPRQAHVEYMDQVEF